MSKILFAGEQVSGLSLQVKGVDYFGVGIFKEEGDEILEALEQGKHDVTRIRTCDVPVHFPESIDELKKFDVIMLSDLGANSLLFHPEMLSKSIPHPNRLKLLRQYVEEGGGLVMIGGWMSFAGIGGKAKYHKTPLEPALPVNCLPYDDRQETPEGVVPEVMNKTHPIFDGVPDKWPFFLGYNEVQPKDDATVLLKFEKDPLLCVWEFGKGRTAAFTTDCAPHWGPIEFLQWEGYKPFWNNLVKWLSKA